jgi:hypothetical protein
MVQGILLFLFRKTGMKFTKVGGRLEDWVWPRWGAGAQQKVDERKEIVVGMGRSISGPFE